MKRENDCRPVLQAVNGEGEGSTGTSRRWAAAVRLIAICATIIACDGPTEPYVPNVQRPAQILKIAGDKQQASPGARLDSVVVVVLDSVGKPISGLGVTFSVESGDGFVGGVQAGIADTGSAVKPRRDSVSRLTNEKGEATARWWIGRTGDNTLRVTTEDAGKMVETVFQASSLSSGYAGGSFALAAGTTRLPLPPNVPGEKCSVKSGSLALSSDGSFHSHEQLECELLFGDVVGADVVETGFYSVLGSTIRLHYLDTGGGAGFFDPRDVIAVLNENSIDLTNFGVKWQYLKVDRKGGPPVAQWKGFVWSPETGFAEIPTPSYAEGLSLTAINNRGQAVGYLTLHEGEADDRAFVWSASEGLKQLGSLVGPDGISWALTIDDNGEVRGLSEGPSTSQGPLRPIISDAFSWTASGGMKPATSTTPERFRPVSQGGKLILPPGHDCMELVRTTTAGFAIGYTGSTQNGRCKVTSALMWEVDGTPVPILGGCDSFCAPNLTDIIRLEDVNNRGEVVGNWPRWGGFRWTRSGGTVPIPDEISEALRINDNGDVVVLADYGDGLKLLLWLASGQMSGIRLPDDVTIEDIAGINNEGHIFGTFR